MNLYISISPSKKDIVIYEELKQYFDVLKRLSYLDSYTDSLSILPGREVKVYSERYIRESNLILPMLSIDYLNNCENEIRLINDLYTEQKDKIVISIILRACLWKEFAFFSELKYLPESAEPISSHVDMDKILQEVFSKLIKIIKDHNKEQGKELVQQYDYDKRLLKAAFDYIDIINQIKSITRHESVELDKQLLKARKELSAIEKSSSEYKRIRINKVLREISVFIGDELDRNLRKLKLSESQIEDIHGHEREIVEKHTKHKSGLETYRSQSIKVLKNSYERTLIGFMKNPKLKSIIDHNVRTIFRFNNLNNLETESSELIREHIENFVLEVYKYIKDELRKLESSFYEIPHIDIRNIERKALLDMSVFEFRDFRIINPFRKEEFKNEIEREIINHFKKFLKEIYDDFDNLFNKEIDYRLSELHFAIKDKKSEMKELEKKLRYDIYSV